MQFGEALKENKWPAELKAGLIGSCTNSSYEDMQRAASVAQQALKAGIKAKACLSVLPCLQLSSCSVFCVLAALIALYSVLSKQDMLAKLMLLARSKTYLPCICLCRLALIRLLCSAQIECVAFFYKTDKQLFPIVDCDQ